MDRVYLILGASSDVGVEYIRELDKENRHVYVIAHYCHSKECLEALKEELNNVEMRIVCCDLTDVVQVDELIEEIKKEKKKPTHILQCAASRIEYAHFKDFEWDKMQNELELQVHSTINIVKAFIKDMARQNYGRIVFVLSAYTFNTPPKFMMGYVIVKYALMGLMKCLASEYGDKGVNINGISPNMMETKFLSSLDSRMIEMNAMKSLKKRNVRKGEVVAGIKFLMSDEASYVNGVNLNITGGDIM